MSTKQQLLIPLINIQSTTFIEQYERGVQWSMYGDEQGKEPVPVSYLVTNLGFIFCKYHGGVSEPSIGQLRSDVTAPAHLDHRGAKWGSVLAESYLIERFCKANEARKPGRSTRSGGRERSNQE